MEGELIPAIWQGPYVAELADMSTIAPGEEHMVSEEDLKSSHWRRVGEAAPEPPEAPPQPDPEPEAPADAVAGPEPDPEPAPEPPGTAFGFGGTP